MYAVVELLMDRHATCAPGSSHANSQRKGALTRTTNLDRMQAVQGIRQNGDALRLKDREGG
ncbi:hypothetical protein SAMN05421548_10564 [Paraburkholderia lycopersici]|uniref:Uncharacterized protein n=1 Tax=Paraburkholderia lycopersici TaxID=416944 RepID=A0A1G6K2J0_9BURK|nr:hypothetical protein SAMN05421548_10564 [Paraburkholderia lycopersici]